MERPPRGWQVPGEGQGVSRTLQKQDWNADPNWELGSWPPLLPA